MQSPRQEPKLPRFSPSFFAVEARRSRPNLHPDWLKRRLAESYQAGFFHASVIWITASVVAYLMIR